MKLRAKICHAAMDDILRGDKNKEHHVLESIILTCTGEPDVCKECSEYPNIDIWPCEFEYEINDFRKTPPAIMEKEHGKYGIPYKRGSGHGITFILGDRIR